MDAIPDPKIIANFGVGHDSTDVDAARERGIIVTNTPDVLNDAGADLAVGLAIDVLRGIAAGDRHVRAVRWVSQAGRQWAISSSPISSGGWLTVQ